MTAKSSRKSSRTAACFTSSCITNTVSSVACTKFNTQWQCRQHRQIRFISASKTGKWQFLFRLKTKVYHLVFVFRRKRPDIFAFIVCFCLSCFAGSQNISTSLSFFSIQSKKYIKNHSFSRLFQNFIYFSQNIWNASVSDIFF